MKSLLVGLLVGTIAGILLRSRGRSVATAEMPSARVAADGPEAPAGTHEDDELERLTRLELYRRAAAAGIQGRSAMTKAELIAALREEERRGPAT